MNKFLFYNIALFLLSVQQSCFCWHMIPGDVQTRDTGTFSFPIQAFGVDQNNNLVAGSCKAGSKEFTLSLLTPDSNTCVACVPRKVIIDGQKDQDNPLYDAHITQVQAYDVGNIFAVTAQYPATLHVLHRTLDHEILSTVITDASGVRPSNGIVALAVTKDYHVFAALKGAQQEHFGIGDSGIALIIFKNETIETELNEKEFEEHKKKVAEAHDEQEQENLIKNIIQKDGKAIKQTVVKTLKQIDTKPLSVSCDCIKIGADVAKISDPVAFYWHPLLERLYVALQVQGASGNSNGARSIIVGRIDGTGKLVFSPLMPDCAVGGSKNEIVASRGNIAPVCAHKICSMRTSGGLLDYLIVLGGNGNEHQTRNTVFALPLRNCTRMEGGIDPELAPFHGTLAHAYAAPFDAFKPFSRGHLFLGRHFTQAPEKPDDIFNSNTIAAQVGGGPLHAGPINDIFVRDDAVYAIVTHANKQHASGIYQSRSIFYANGTIALWTRWEKVAETSDSIFGAFLDSARGIITALTGREEIRNIQKNAWQCDDAKTSEDLVSLINLQFNKQTGGIQELIDFCTFTPGLRGVPLLCATGLEKVVLAQRNPMGQYSISNVQQFKNGAIDKILYNNTCVMVLSGGDLEKIGPINAAQVAINEDYGWLFVGGAHGLAVLCNDDGTGWAMPRGLGYNFDGLQAGMAFKMVGDYQFVRKLIYDNNFLYVLTDQYLDRIDLRSDSPLQSVGSAVCLADAQAIANSQYAILHDVIISEKLAILAHSGGLSRVGNGKDIRSDTHETINWTPIPLADVCDPIIALSPITVTGRAQDIACFEAGQCYVVTGNVGKNTGHINRLTINSVVGCAITDNTVEHVHDFICPDRISNYANIGSVSTLFTSDGALFFTTAHQKKVKHLALMQGFGASKATIPLSLPEGSIITHVVRSSVCGNWLVAGDFGLRINE